VEAECLLHHLPQHYSAWHLLLRQHLEEFKPNLITTLLVDACLLEMDAESLDQVRVVALLVRMLALYHVSLRENAVELIAQYLLCCLQWRILVIVDTAELSKLFI
jgi:hypothetical protein